MALTEVFNAILGALRGPVDTGWLPINGIGTGSAYASSDAFGTGGHIVGIPTRGVIAEIQFLDLDDEGIAKTLLLFDSEFTATADNAALNIADIDAFACQGTISISAADFLDMGACQVATSLNINKHYVAPNGLYYQFRTEGADNIAAGSLPRFRMRIWPA